MALFESNNEIEFPIRETLSEFAINEAQEMELATVAVQSNESLDFLFADEIKCPICLEILDKTWTVSACLHRFCCECLHKSLRQELGSQRATHECPLCRVKLASRRSSKPDPNFDKIIAILTDGNLNTDLKRFDSVRYVKKYNADVQQFREKAKYLRENAKNHNSNEFHQDTSSSSSVKLHNKERESIQYVQWSLQPYSKHNLERNFEQSTGPKILKLPIQSDELMLDKCYLRTSAAMKISDIEIYLFKKLFKNEENNSQPIQIKTSDRRSANFYTWSDSEVRIKIYVLKTIFIN